MEGGVWYGKYFYGKRAEISANTDGVSLNNGGNGK